VSSVHWSQDGTRLVTSSNDMMARIWRFEEESGQFEIEMVKTFGVMLMISKFNKMNPGDPKSTPQLVATGGHSGVITIWTADAKSASNKDVAKLHHEELDPNLVGLELDWQNSRTLAVTGHSKNIYLWSVDTPTRPIQVWSGGHTQEIE
jgi:WD40 repeat protein